MKIKHKIENNTITLDVQLKPKNHRSNTTIVFDIEEVKQYCKENDIPIGELIYARQALCDNRTIPNSRETWIFSISREYKKSLTKKSKPAIISDKKVAETKTRKKPSARERATRIARNKNKSKGVTTNGDSKGETTQEES